MNPPKPTSQKHLAVSQNNRRITVAAAGASALVVFMLVGGHSMINRMGYQRKVAAKQHQAITTLKADQSALSTLKQQYVLFSSANPNMLGVSNSGTEGDQGSNARIALDALPSQYDFPALTSSIEKILSGRGITPQSIDGTDSGASGSAPSSANPQPQPMQFTFTAVTNYQGAKDLLNDFQRSIRPFKVVSLDLTGSNNALTINATMQTFYQPSKTLNINSMVIK